MIFDFSPMTFLLCISIYDSNNQNLISVMYFGSLFNASYAGTSSYFKRGIFGANSGRVFTNFAENSSAVIKWHFATSIETFHRKKMLQNIIVKLLTLCIWSHDQRKGSLSCSLDFRTVQSKTMPSLEKLDGKLSYWRPQ